RSRPCDKSSHRLGSESPWYNPARSEPTSSPALSSSRSSRWTSTLIRQENAARNTALGYRTHPVTQRVQPLQSCSSHSLRSHPCGWCWAKQQTRPLSKTSTSNWMTSWIGNTSDWTPTSQSKGCGLESTEEFEATNAGVLAS